MPFLSQAQRSFMFARHPSIARRWAAEYGPQSGLPKHVNETTIVNRPGVNSLPRRTSGTDYRHLHPSQSARHPPAGQAKPNEKEAMSEGAVEKHLGSRHSEMSLKPPSLGEFHKRDLQATGLKGGRHG